MRAKIHELIISRIKQVLIYGVDHLLVKTEESQPRALLTDLYELTMNAAYIDNGKADEIATFEMFIRSLQPDWGYFIAVGVEEAVDYACNLRFTDDDIMYLQGLGLFNDEYFDYLRHFRFEGEIKSIREGTPFTAGSPVLTVTAKRPQAQLLETSLLNIINFQTLIASKASRVVNAANGAKVVDFGLRRAQGFDAGMKGARATYIAGVVATSNVEAAKIYGIPPSGTMSHSFVMGFPEEIESFRAYSHTFPRDSTLLIDTYDTLDGARRAIVVAKEMEKLGRRLSAVRLDSGNMEGLAKRVRNILDEAGFSYVKIVLSSDLNEYKIDEYRRDGVPVDFYGVGTEMITAKPVASLPGVYKLVEDNYGPRIKLSEGKLTYPGRKQVYRVEGSKGEYVHDVLELEGEPVSGIPLLKPVVKHGKRIHGELSLSEIRDYCLDCVARLPERVKRVKVIEPYELRVSQKLNTLKDDLRRQYSN